MLHRYYIIHPFLFNNCTPLPPNLSVQLVAPHPCFVQMKIVFGV